MFTGQMQGGRDPVLRDGSCERKHSQPGREKSIECSLKARDPHRDRPWRNSRPAEPQPVSPCASMGPLRWVNRVRVIFSVCMGP